MTALQYNRYNAGRRRRRAENGLELAWMTRKYIIEKMVKSPGKSRGYTGIRSKRLGAGGWGECFRHSHCKQEGRKAWGVGRLSHARHWRCLRAHSFVTMGKMRHSRPQKSGHGYFCLSIWHAHETLPYCPCFPVWVHLTLRLNVSRSLDTWSCWIAKHLPWTGMKLMSRNLNMLLFDTKTQ